LHQRTVEPQAGADEVCPIGTPPDGRREVVRHQSESGRRQAQRCLSAAFNGNWQAPCVAKAGDEAPGTLRRADEWDEQPAPDD
jgi:hypothetical protein